MCDVLKINLIAVIIPLLIIPLYLPMNNDTSAIAGSLTDFIGWDNI